jgi:hypothetical protein
MTKITLKIKIKNMNSVFYFLYKIMKYIVPFYFRLEDYISDTQIILTIFSWPWKKLEFQRLVYGYYYNSHSLNLMQIHPHEVKILQIHNARPEFVKNITAVNQSESSILIRCNYHV